MRRTISSSCIFAGIVLSVGWLLAQLFDRHAPSDSSALAIRSAGAEPAAAGVPPVRSPAPSDIEGTGEAGAVDLVEAAAELPPVDLTTPTSVAPAAWPTWAEPPSALDALIQSGPEVRSGPANELTAITSGTDGTRAVGSRAPGWKPDRESPLHPVARFSLTRIAPNGAHQAAEMHSAPAEPTAAAPRGLAGRSPHSSQQPGDAGFRASPILPPPRDAIVGATGYATPFALVDENAGVAARQPRHVVMQPGLQQRARPVLPD